MALARTTWQLVVVALAIAACSCSQGGGGGGPLPGFDAPPPSGLFPLRVSGDGGYLVTSDGQPFLVHGEAAWSLIVQLSANDAMRYLADRHARGVNTLIVSLIEHFYADDPPSNAAGVDPFTRAGDFSTPNDAYFAHADQVIDLAASQGMVVLLFPSYLGLQAQEGWRDEMSAMGSVAGAPKCASYGTFLGQRFASKKNIIWVWGGDFTPGPGSPAESCLKAIRDSLLAASPAGTLSTGHWEPESTSRSQAAFASSIDIVGVYTYGLALPKCRAARSQTPRMPTFLIETCYEGETFGRCPSKSDVRRQQWWGLLGCGAGEIYGVEGIWQFDRSWSQKLGAPVSIGEQRLIAIAQQVAWHTMALDDALVTAGRGTPGSDAELAAARSADGKQALIYVPPAGAPTITVDLTRMSGSVTAVWQDPTADRSVADGSGLTGSRAFTRPSGANQGGDTDWVLVLTIP